MIFRVSGRTSEPRLRKHAELFFATAKSLRHLTSAERAGLEAVRLRLVTTNEEETLAALAQRTGTVWRATEIALANGLPKDGVLGAPRLVKVALAEPWQPPPEAAPGPAQAGESGPPAPDPR